MAGSRVGLTEGAEERCSDFGQELEESEEVAARICRNSARVEAVCSGSPAAKPHDNFVPADSDRRYREVGSMF